MRIWYQLISSETAMKNFIACTQGLCDRAASPGTTVEVRGTRQGALGDQYRLLWHYDVREVLENGLDVRRKGGYDAFVIANSLDPALVELREILDIPVLSFMEISCFVACTMGERFGLVVPNARMGPRYREIPYGYGLSDRLVAVESAGYENIRGFDEVFTDTALGDECIEAGLAAARRAIVKGADVVIPAGPLTALMASRGIYVVDDVPLLDAYSLLVKAAEMMVGMHRLTGVCVSRRQLYQAPPADLIRRAAEVRNIPALRD